MLTDLDYDLLSAYIDDALTDEERASLESRLQTEPELRSELEELRATVLLLNNLPPRKAPRDFTLDARYARRTSFFASAAFSALSTAAAVILFAVGAFLFTNNNQPPTSSGQAAQVAMGSTAATATSSTTLDKGLIETETMEDVTNDVAPVTAPTILQESTVETLADGVVEQATTTLQNEQESGVPSLFQADAEAPADAQDSNNDTFNVAPASPVESQERSTEATETVTGQFFGMQPQPTMGAMGGAAPVAPPAYDTGDAMSSMMMEPTETPTSSEVISSAMQQPAATFAPSSTALPTATDTPTLTLTSTATNTLVPTATSTPEPTPVPPVERERADSSNLLPLAVLVLASVFLVLGVATTIARRSR